MNNQIKIREKIIYLCFGIGFLAIITNSSYFFFVIFINGLGISRSLHFSSLFLKKEFVLFYMNILIGLLYIYFGYSLSQKKKWAESLFLRFKYFLFAPVIIIVYVIGPLLKID